MPEHSGAQPARFPTTRTSVVQGLASADHAERRRSWEAVVAAYWRPAYKHLRLKWRLPREDAEDATQAFFARAFEREFFAEYNPQRARFRAFLRVCLDRLASNEEKGKRRKKRGGEVTHVPLDFEAAETELAQAGSAGSPDEVFDREWRRSLIARAVDALSNICDPDTFTIFERYDLCEGDRPTYADLSRDLGLPVTTITNRLYRARRELRQLILEELTAITADEDEFREEARWVLDT